MRITPSELSAIDGRAAIETELTLPGGSWQLRLEPWGDAFVVNWVDGVVVIGLDEDSRQALLDPAAEGVYQGAEPEGPRVSIEKDFPCAHPHPPEARETVTERFAPTESYRARKGLTGGG